MPTAASLFVPGRNCCAVARAHRVSLLIDGEAYFNAFCRAAERATRSIVVLAWDFSSSTRLRFGDGDRHQPPARLGDFLNWLARRRHTLQIHVLDWDYPLVFGTDREFPPVWGLGWKAHHRVEVAYDNTHPVGGSHHQKVVVIDDAMAFVGGFDLTDRRWDTPAHRVHDGRRRAGKVDYPPFHDLMMAVDGEAARALGELARDRWLAATEEALPPVTAAADPWPPDLAADLVDVDVAIARTLPPGPGRAAVREVEALYLDMIAAARHSIYIENQYFTAHAIGDALAARLAEPDGPEIVIVLRLLSHGWLEEHTMQLLRTGLIQRLRTIDRHGRLAVYYPHIDGLKDGTCLDIHAKLMIVDDELLRIGSANLCNRSLGLDSECDAAIEARGDPVVGAAIARFRNRLLGEHLDRSPARVAQEIGRQGSIIGAIEALAGGPRTLRLLEREAAWPEAVVELARIADPVGPLLGADEITATQAPREAVADWRRGGRRLLFIVLLLGGLTALWRYTPLAGLLAPERVVAWAHEFSGRPWAPLAILLAYTPACVVLFPRALITLAAIVAFGPLTGAAYALCGLLLAAFLSYVAGRELPRHTVRHLTGPSLNRMAETLRRRGLVAVTALRLVPIAPFAFEGLVAGAIHIRLWHFMLGTLLGLLPGTVVTAVFGNEIGEALQGRSSISYGLVAGLAVLLIGLIVLVRRWLLAESHHAGHRTAA
ncbi:MAG TPA: VTT domain-containing protein [Azonexus sp.]